MRRAAAEQLAGKIRALGRTPLIIYDGPKGYLVGVQAESELPGPGLVTTTRQAQELLRKLRAARRNPNALR